MGSGGAGLDIGVGRELFYDQVVTFRPSFLNLDPLQEQNVGSGIQL